jgi:hypothetical protein
LEEFPGDPGAAEFAADEEGNGGAADIAEEIQKEAPPNAEEKPTADGEDAAGQKEHIAGAVEQGIQDRTPELHRPDLLLQPDDEIDDGIMVREPGDDDRRKRETGELDKECAFELRHGSKKSARGGGFPERGRQCGDVGRGDSATAAQQADAAFGQGHGGGGEFLGSHRMDELMVVGLGQAGAGKGGESLSGIEAFEQMKGVRAIDTIHADDFGIGCADFGDGGPKSRGVVAGEQGHRRAVVEGLLGIECDEQFIRVEKSLEENELATAIEEGADLLGEDLVPVDSAGRGFFRSDAKRTDTAGDVNALPTRDILGQLRGGPIDFADAMLAAMLGEAHGVGPEAVRFDDPRTGSDKAFVDSTDDLGLADTQLFQAAPGGDAGGEELGSHSPIAEQDAVLKFIEKIHGRGDYSRRAGKLPRTKAGRSVHESVLVSGTDVR